MIPSHQRFEAGEHFSLKRHDRLIVHAKLFTLDSAPQVGFEFEQGNSTRVHGALKQLMPRFAAVFRAIHGGVGVAQHILGVFAAVHTQTNADARGGVHLVAVQTKRLQ